MDQSTSIALDPMRGSYGGSVVSESLYRDSMLAWFVTYGLAGLECLEHAVIN
jgi:hypothetical protein